MIELPKRHRPTVDASINIVPYIDVMLVLLVIFMMTTPIIDQGIEINLPETNSEMNGFIEHYQPPTIISMNKKGDYFINSLDEDSSGSDEVKKSSLRAVVISAKARLEVYPTMKVLIRGDKDVTYGSVIALMSFLHKNGITKASLATEYSDKR
jgi:biopolymer transport protein TolR